MDFQEIIKSNITVSNNVKVSVRNNTMLISIPKRVCETLLKVKEGERVAILRDKSTKKFLIKKSASYLHGYKLLDARNYLNFAITISKHDPICSVLSGTKELRSKKYQDGYLFDATKIISQSAL